MARSFHAAGGDTRLLLLEAGKQLLDGGDALAVPGAAGLVDARSVLRLVSVQERILAGQLRRRVSRDDPNDHLGDIEYLAQVHLRRRILQEFGTVVSAASGQWRTLLKAALHLYGLDVLLDSAAWHLNHGSMRPGDVDVLRQAHTTAAEYVIQYLDPLIDGLAVPPGRVGGFIGQADYVDRVAAMIRQDPY
jgi:acyl-CoA oxidase